MSQQQMTLLTLVINTTESSQTKHTTAINSLPLFFFNDEQECPGGQEARTHQAHHDRLLAQQVQADP